MSTEKQAQRDGISFSPKTVKQNFSKFQSRKAKFADPLLKRNNDGTFKNINGHIQHNNFYGSPIYTPQRKKFKGYQREARRYKKAA